MPLVRFVAMTYLPPKIIRNTVYQDAVTVNSFSFNPKIEEGSQNHKFLSRVCPENNLLDSHPLPLPPRAATKEGLLMKTSSSSEEGRERGGGRVLLKQL